VKKFLGHSIKALQTDGGSEFIKFKPYSSSQGITHRLSCPHTSVQNDTTERKYRHLVETGLTLLTRSNVSFHYWPYVFQIASFLINRIPTPVFHNLSSYHKLFHKAPDYLFLRIFDFACHPYMRPYQTHEFDFRSSQCVFLGYLASHKSYQYLHVPFGRIYICRDVVFDESSFSFQSPLSSLSLPTYSNALTTDPHLHASVTFHCSSLFSLVSPTIDSFSPPLPSLSHTPSPPPPLAPADESFSSSSFSGSPSPLSIRTQHMITRTQDNIRT